MSRVTCHEAPRDIFVTMSGRCWLDQDTTETEKSSVDSVHSPIRRPGPGFTPSSHLVTTLWYNELSQQLNSRHWDHDEELIPDGIPSRVAVIIIKKKRRKKISRAFLPTKAPTKNNCFRGLRDLGIWDPDSEDFFSHNTVVLFWISFKWQRLQKDCGMEM